MKEKTILPTIVFFIIIVLSVAQLFLSNMLTTDGLELSRLEEETRALEERNTQLEEEITKTLSLVNIASRAAELGMVREGQVLSISSTTRIALHQ